METAIETPLFENETLLDRKLLKEAVNASYGILNWISRIVWAAFGVILLGLGAYLLIFAKVYIPAYILLVLGIYLLIVTFQPRGIGRPYRSILAVNPSAQYHFLFYDDHFEQVTPVSSATLTYVNVTKVFDTKNTYTLLFGFSLIVLSKTGFQKSTDKDVGEVLRQKCGGARFYRK
ncbi:MAG: hypothetical protein FWC62_09620 [Firmicutes bacterium]|nr:hypothetical protein [Bacillota bacterium]